MAVVRVSPTGDGAGTQLEGTRLCGSVTAEGGVLDLVWVRICGLKRYRCLALLVFVNVALKTKITPKFCLHGGNAPR